jgi:asparagine synthase (glutamine-hydrolysing)
MKALADEHLSEQNIQDAGLLNETGVRELFELHENPNTTIATQVQLDAVINHMLSVQIMHKHFVKTDVPAQAMQRAEQYGWLP